MRESLWRLRGIRSLVAVTFTGFCGYAVLLPVAPLWALHGGAGTAGSGLVNGVLLVFTVVTQMLVPPALRRFGWGPVLTTGLVLLGAPAALYAVSDALGPILVLSAVRGMGFGVLTVTGSSAVVALVGRERRGEAIGVYGLAVALPNLLLLPAGPWVTEHVGFWPVFLLVGILPFAGVPAALRLAQELHGSGPERHAPEQDPTALGRLDAASYRRLLRPMVLLASVTLAGGAALTFVPQMADDELLATAALFVMGLVTAFARWRAGLLADRYGVQRFLWPLVLVSATGAVLVAWSVADPGETVAALLLAAMVVLGLAYGALQNLTLVAAFGVVSRRHHDVASAVWNIGFDAGTALGSVLVGVVAEQTSFTTAFVVVAVLAVAVLPLAVHRPRPVLGG